MNECLVNGEISTLVETTNRGLNYGDGIFETLLVHNGRPRRWQGHMERLGVGCERLGLMMPPLQSLSTETVADELRGGGEAEPQGPSKPFVDDDECHMSGDHENGQ